MISDDYKILEKLTCNGVPVSESTKVGIGCSRGSVSGKDCVVEELSMPNCGLKEIPNALQELTHLKWLEMYDNYLVEDIAPLGKNKRLQYIDMTNNAVHAMGKVEALVADLEDLEVLYLDDNPIDQEECDQLKDHLKNIRPNVSLRCMFME